MIRRAWIVLVGLLIGGGFYLLLIDTNDLPELYVLAGVAPVCGLLFLISREEGFEEAQIRPAWLAGAWRLAVKIPLDIALVCWQALAQLVRPRPSRGEFRAVRFRAVARTPQDSGRRALTEAVGSVAPNTVVIGVDADRGVLLVHQLSRQGDAKDLDLLRLG
jgi:Na+/H+ ion antiporter subunit